MLRPHHQAGLAHLLRGGQADLPGAAHHPGQHAHPVGEDHDALGAHPPQGAGEGPFVQVVDKGHGQQVIRVAVGDHPVGGVRLQPDCMAHQVGGQLAGEAAPVGVTPQELGRRAVPVQPEEPQVVLRVALYVLEVLARAGDQEIPPGQGGDGEPRGDLPQDPAQVQVRAHLVLVQQQADVAAVALVPAQPVHVGGGMYHFLQKRRAQNILHGDGLPLSLSRRGNRVWRRISRTDR